MAKESFKLFRLACEDLLVLVEMEYNGMVFDSKGALSEAKELEYRLEELEHQFKGMVGNPIVDINSGKHVSAVLYGGSLDETIKVVCGVYRSGGKKGQTKYKNETISHTFERLVEPLPKTETKRSIGNREKGKTSGETEWSVEADVLKKLKAKKEVKLIINLILEYRELYKLKSTYLEGWTNMISHKKWKEDMIYGNLNQCVVVTGRLSSSQPNLQNADKKTKKYLVSRYDY